MKLRLDEEKKTSSFLLYIFINIFVRIAMLMKTLKKHLPIFIILSSIFALFGVINHQAGGENLEVVEATQHADNFDNYSYSGNYYDSITATGEGLNGTLRTALTDYILPKDWPTYSGTSGAKVLANLLQEADEDPTNSSNMIYLYTRDSVKKNAASSWNREHVWPQSLSNSCWGTGKGGSDLLHIRPTYNTTNSTRSNAIYADLSDTSSATNCVYNSMNYGRKIGSTKFEPLDSVKGDVARIVMYVWVAYKDYYGSKLPALTNVFESYDTLLKWHTLDRPDVGEGNRNDYAEKSIQKNRNPFVDHPEYAWMIFGDSASSSVKEACKAIYPSGGSSVTLSSISVTTQPTKSTYYVNESLDTTGLVITARYSDNSTKNVTSLCTYTPTTFSSVGNQTVSVSYLGKNTSFTVYVKDYEQVTLESVTAYFDNNKFYVDSSYQVKYSINPLDAYPYPTISFASSNTSVATVSSSGLVSIKAVGTVNITVTASQNSVVRNSILTIATSEKDMTKVQDLYDIEKDTVVTFYCLYLGAYSNSYKGIFVGDGDYGILIYGYSASISYEPYKDYLKVTGKVDEYSGARQIAKPDSGSLEIEKIDESVGKQYVRHVSTYIVDGYEVETGDMSILSRPCYINGTVKSIDKGSFKSTEDTQVTITLDNDRDTIVYIKNNSGLDYSELESELGTVGNRAKIKGFVGYHSPAYQIILPVVVSESSTYTASKFADDFLSITGEICILGYSNKNDLQEVWLSLELDKYAILSISEQNILMNASASESGTNIERAMARYDYVVGKYHLTNFISGRTINYLPYVEDNISNNSVAYIVIISVSIGMISSLAIIFTYKKRKHN